MAMIDRNFTFATNGTVTANDLHNLIDSATIYQDLITGQLPITSVGTNYELLIADGTNPNAAPNAVTVYDLFEDALTAGTYTGLNLSGALTYGTATGTRLVSTNATITTGTITTGVIPTLTSSTATFGTTTSTAATITSGTITNLASTTGTIATLNSTTGTIATLNSTTGTIATLNSTTGTIATLNSTTPTFLGAITASTNTINVGSGQIYKDSSGNVGVGTNAPDTRLHTYYTSAAPSYAESAAGLNLEGSSSVRLLFGTDPSSPFAAWIQTSNTGSPFPIALNPLGGNVGIGAASPSYKLQVTDNTNDALISASGAADNIGLRVSNTQTGGRTYRILAPATGSGYSVGGLVFEDQGVGARMAIDSSGGVTIAGLAGAGSRAVNASAAGLLSAASDASLKEEVVGASIAGLNEILQIHPKMYRWKDDIANRGENASVELGFIANDVAPIIPSAAPLGNDGLYGFYDRSITAALVKAVQELKAENDSLKSRIEALEVK